MARDSFIRHLAARVPALGRGGVPMLIELPPPGQAPLARPIRPSMWPSEGGAAPSLGCTRAAARSPLRVARAPGDGEPLWRWLPPSVGRAARLGGELAPSRP